MSDFTEELTPAQKRVLEEATRRLKKCKWYRGTCLDNFPTDQYCRDDFENAVNSVYDETAMWDAE